MPQFLSGQLSLTEKQTGSSRKQGKRWLFLHQYFFSQKNRRLPQDPLQPAITNSAASTNLQAIKPALP
jgi:hypothetical protein